VQAWLDKKRRAGRPHARVAQMDPDVPPAAWAVVRWIVGSCTAHLEELTDNDELVQGVGARRCAA
jgi:ubiquitin-conjugating enzyme E2 Q